VDRGAHSFCLSDQKQHPVGPRLGEATELVSCVEAEPKFSGGRYQAPLGVVESASWGCRGGALQVPIPGCHSTMVAPLWLGH
jgi:hypothetical protein